MQGSRRAISQFAISKMDHIPTSVGGPRGTTEGLRSVKMIVSQGREKVVEQMQFKYSSKNNCF